ncbi:MAG: sigma-70 family RNA polymerase sigma factor [Terracidiphilus sp.]
MNSESGEITQLLAKMKVGNPDAEARLFSLIYGELRRIARNYMYNERADHSLQPTALVHEAYLRLCKMQSVDWQNRSHFLAVSAHTMRRILVDHARAKHAEKRGLEWNQVSIEVGELSAAAESIVNIVELDEALGRLETFDQRQAKIVEMRFFGGLSEDEIGAELGISERTVKRDWRIAKAWLYRELLQSGRSANVRAAASH